MASVTKLQVENNVFPSTVVKPPNSNNTFFLGGAGFCKFLHKKIKIYQTE